jgi:hypothetical protein
MENIIERRVCTLLDQRGCRTDNVDFKQGLFHGMHDDLSFFVRRALRSSRGVANAKTSRVLRTFPGFFSIRVYWGISSTDP